MICDWGRVSVPMVLAWGLFTAGLQAVETAEQTVIVSAEKIWERAHHSAFTDLIRYDGDLYCAFREGSGHIPGLNGTIRVIRSRDGHAWQSVALLDEAHVDLRDPKLSIMPNGRLMLNMGASYYHGRRREKIESRVCFGGKNEQGELTFGPLKKVVFPERLLTGTDWLWRVTWHKGVAYGCLQQVPKDSPRALHLISSEDGVAWKHVATLDVPDANETTLRFAADDTLIAMIRRDASDKPSVGHVGMARPPYTEWKINASNKPFGGPNFVQLPGGRWLAGSRGFSVADPRNRSQRDTFTELWWLDPKTAQVREIVRLPSKGDTSYPGFVIDEQAGRVYVSYYSGDHEAKATIHLATLRLDALLKGPE